MLKESNLTDLPCAVVACYMDSLQPRIPGGYKPFFYSSLTRFSWILALAVASGSAVFLFKALRPYYKFVLPQLDIAQVEKDVWLKAREVRLRSPTVEEKKSSGQRIRDVGIEGWEWNPVVDLFSIWCDTFVGQYWYSGNARRSQWSLSRWHCSFDTPITSVSLSSDRRETKQEAHCRFLQMSDTNEAFQYVEHYKHLELKRQVKWQTRNTPVQIDLLWRVASHVWRN